MFEIISHRGNLNFPNENENSPSQIMKAIKKFRVEIDVWNIDDAWWLGHDSPAYKVDFSFFDSSMFLHCKNIEAVSALHGSKLNWFWHEKDQLVLTGHGELWCFPKNYMKDGITVLIGEPEKDVIRNLPSHIRGLCTDYPLKLEKLQREIQKL